ncbi:SAM-dependent methyltransferase, partial [Mycolicibacterium austroafricanum]
RAYGGGMLKIEPREADVLPVPSPDLLRRNTDQLRQVRPAVAARLRAGRLLDAVALVDDALLLATSTLSERALRAVRRDHAALTARRLARGKANGAR